MKLISQGAEAKIFLDEGRNLIVKDRIAKSYRHPELDKRLRKRRTKSEKKILKSSRELAGINVPDVKDSEDFDKIYMDFVEGKRLSEHLDGFELERQKEFMKEVGRMIARIHSREIIHGDLTTSNLVLKPSEEIYLIDFGLGSFSKKLEDKAVDLRLFKQAIEAKHFENFDELFEQVLEGYKEISEEAGKVIERMKRVENRRRYKQGS